MTTVRPSPPPAVRWITRTLEEAGFDTWAVGGAVRDAFLGHPSGDWDLATRATPDEMRRLFKRTVPIGVEHGTLGILARDGTMFEVTTFRRDVETDGRHAVVSFADTVEDDLARRDFTINAVAWHPLREQLLDPHGGMADLEAGILRTVGRARERFAEDYLRILRALRFAGRFGLRVDDATWEAACALKDHLSGLSVERIREELVKILEADPAPSVSLGLYASSGALETLYPELADLPDEVWTTALAAVDHLPPGRPYLRLAALMRPLEAEKAASVLLRLRLSNLQTDEVALRAAAPPMPRAEAPGSVFRHWLSRVGAERVSPLARMELAYACAAPEAGQPTPMDVVASWRAARRVRAEAPPLAVGDLALDGRDLIRLGLKPGRHFGRILEALLQLVLDDPALNEAGFLEEEALKMAEEGVGSDGV